jgi:hypothetical protein
MTLFRSRQSATASIWALLVAATIFSWFLSGEVGEGAVISTIESLTVMAVAFIKLRLVGLEFMELRNAPMGLRVVFETYVLIGCAAVTVLYLSA